MSSKLVSRNHMCATVCWWCHLVKATEVTAGLAESKWQPIAGSMA